jgi:hypothetical protein
MNQEGINSFPLNDQGHAILSSEEDFRVFMSTATHDSIASYNGYDYKKFISPSERHSLIRTPSVNTYKGDKGRSQLELSGDPRVDAFRMSYNQGRFSKEEDRFVSFWLNGERAPGRIHSINDDGTVSLQVVYNNGLIKMYRATGDELEGLSTSLTSKGFFQNIKPAPQKLKPVGDERFDKFRADYNNKAIGGESRYISLIIDNNPTPRPARVDGINEDGSLVVSILDSKTSSVTRTISFEAIKMAKLSDTSRQYFRRYEAANIDEDFFVLSRHASEGGKINPESDYYIKSQQAVHYFDDWFWKNSGDSFTTATNHMHRLSVYKNSRFTGVTKTPEQYAGIIRPTGIANSTRPEAYRYAEEIAKRFNLGKVKSGSLLIHPSIPIEISPANNLLGSLGHHMYPDGNYLKKYYEVAGQELNSIRTQIKGKDYDIQAVRAQIGRYYQVMANTRPYENVNNAMFMNQVNYLLRLTGHPGIPHGSLDHLMVRLDHHQAEIVWDAALQGRLPTDRQLGINTN